MWVLCGIVRRKKRGSFFEDKSTPGVTGPPLPYLHASSFLTWSQNKNKLGQRHWLKNCKHEVFGGKVTNFPRDGVEGKNPAWSMRLQPGNDHSVFLAKKMRLFPNFQWCLRNKTGWCLGPLIVRSAANFPRKYRKYYDTYGQKAPQKKCPPDFGQTVYLEGWGYYEAVYNQAKGRFLNNS